MKFQLYLKARTNHLWIIAEGQRMVLSDYLLLSERDPDQEIQFQEGYAYYNPLLKRTDASQLFLVNGAAELIGYLSGKAPGPLSKADQRAAQRGWFQLIPRNLSESDIPPNILQQLRANPKMKGVISQALRTGMGLRVPEELEISDYADWMSWITSHRMAVTPLVKNCFRSLKTDSGYLIFPQETRTFLLTGTQPESQIQVRIRRCEIKIKKQFTRQLFESLEQKLVLPKSVVDAGYESILARAKESLTEGWDEIVDDYPTGTDLVIDDSPSAEEVIETGLIILVKAPDDVGYRLLTGSPEFNRPGSIYDIFAKVIEQEEYNDRAQT